MINALVLSPWSLVLSPQSSRSTEQPLRRNELWRPGLDGELHDEGSDQDQIL
jgi:hypothetical protein